MAFGGHARVGQDLRDRIFCRRAFLAGVCFAERLDVVERVVVADVLEGIRDRLDEVFWRMIVMALGLRNDMGAE